MAGSMASRLILSSPVFWLVVSCRSDVSIAAVLPTRIPLGVGGPIWWLASSNKTIFRQDVSVPSLVELDLKEIGVIEDPYRASNPSTPEWVIMDDWIYNTTFSVDTVLEKYQNPTITLVAESLDTIATVRLNAVTIGSSNNMHRRFVVNIAADNLRVGENDLAIEFASAISYGQQQSEDHPCDCDDCCRYDNGYTTYAACTGRPWVRKEQSAYGWNWGKFLGANLVWHYHVSVNTSTNVDFWISWRSLISCLYYGKAEVCVPLLMCRFIKITHVNLLNI